MRGVKQIQDQLNVIEEILLERATPSNQIRNKNRHNGGKTNGGGLTSSEVVHFLRCPLFDKMMHI